MQDNNAFDTNFNRTGKGERVLLSTANPSHVTSHKIIVNAVLKSEEYHANQKLGLYIAGESSRPSFKLLAIGYLIKIILSGKILGGSAVDIRYKGILLGRYSVSQALRNPHAYRNKLLYYLRLARGLLKSIVCVEEFLYLKDRVTGCYINDPSYLNGVYRELCAKYGKSLYHNKYPYRLTRFVYSPNSDPLEAFVVQPTSSEASIAISKGKKILNEITASSEKIDYMADTSFESKKIYASDAQAVIYCHSFTDAQQDFGGDKAFLNMLDWLEFTIEKLKYKKIILKAHPNFYRQGYLTKIFEWDRKIFDGLVKKLKQRSNIIIVDWPMRNDELLSAINENCVLISHHGSALVEGAGRGFKCISSESVPWRKYNLFNTWKTREEYGSLLDNLSCLESESLDKIYMYIYDLYSSPWSFFSKEGWRQIVAEQLGVEPRDISKDRRILDKITESDLQSVIKKTSQGIRTVYVSSDGFSGNSPHTSEPVIQHS